MTRASEAAATGAPRRSGFALLSLGALGVVFGDIGTSPLYAFSEIFIGAHTIVPLDPRVFGAASLVFWTLTLIVSVKYVLIVMRADNDGEGGIMALAALTTAGLARASRRRWVLMGIGVFGAALFYGDGMITPAVSVLSAVEGLEVAAPELRDFVIPIAIVVLTGVFAAQRYGTGRVGRLFGPVMLVWFALIGAFGLMSVLSYPQILASVNPAYAVDFFVSDPVQAFLALGSVVLCVTGAEALYADMGHFGRGPIRFSWFVVAVPALYLNYLGQAALVAQQPAAVDNTFYLLVPDLLKFPMVIMATVATVIASQAVLSGAFSMTQQAVRLGYLPRIRVLHTSASEHGQVYVPLVNWMLYAAVVALILGFETSSHLASAYGIAVTGTFCITTLLITSYARRHWSISPLVLYPVATVFFAIDLAFFAANLTKFDHGGWFPLAAAFLVFFVLMTWARGRALLLHRTRTPSLEEFGARLSQEAPMHAPGTLVFLGRDGETPLFLAERERIFKVMSETTIVVSVDTATVPRIEDPSDRVAATQVAPGLWDVRVSYGFMELPDLPGAVAATGIPVADPGSIVYAFSRAYVEVTDDPGLSRLRKDVFAIMVRNTVDSSTYYQVPADQAIEIGRVVRL